MPIPRAELTPMWRQPNSRGYAGYSQRFAGFGDLTQDRAISGNVPYATMLAMPWIFTQEQKDAAKRIRDAVNAPSSSSSSSQSMLDQAAAAAKALQDRINGSTSGGASGGYDTGGYYPTTTGLNPKVLAIGAAVLVGALLLMSPKKKGSVA